MAKIHITMRQKNAAMCNERIQEPELVNHISFAMMLKTDYSQLCKKCTKMFNQWVAVEYVASNLSGVDVDNESALQILKAAWFILHDIMVSESNLNVEYLISLCEHTFTRPVAVQAIRLLQAVGCIEVGGGISKRVKKLKGETDQVYQRPRYTTDEFYASGRDAGKSKLIRKMQETDYATALGPSIITEVKCDVSIEFDEAITAADEAITAADEAITAAADEERIAAQAMGLELHEYLNIVIGVKNGAYEALTADDADIVLECIIMFRDRCPEVSNLMYVRNYFRNCNAASNYEASMAMVYMMKIGLIRLSGNVGSGRKMIRVR